MLMYCRCSPLHVVAVCSVIFHPAELLEYKEYKGRDKRDAHLLIHSNQGEARYTHSAANLDGASTTAQRIATECSNVVRDGQQQRPRLDPKERPPDTGAGERAHHQGSRHCVLVCVCCAAVQLSAAMQCCGS